MILTALQRNRLFVVRGVPACGSSRRSSTAIRAGIVRQSRGQRNPADRRARRLRIRTDLSATLFFSQPEEYDGGELAVEDTYGVHSVKLPPDT